MRLGGEVRVAFAGASGTGKTTLARALGGALGAEVCPVGARSVAAAMGYSSPYEVDAAGRRAEFQARLLQDKAEWEASHDRFITDRTPADNLAYTMLHAPDEAPGMRDAVRDGLSRYTHVFYCPVTAFCDIAGDPVRVADVAYQMEYDVALRRALEETGVKFTEIVSGDLGERLGVALGEVLRGAPAQRRRLPDERPGVVRKISIADVTYYLRTGEYEGGSLGEVFITCDGAPGGTQGLLDALALSVSLGLQAGIPIEAFCSKFEHTRFDPQGPTGDGRLKFASSPLDAVFRYLRGKYGKG